MDVRYQRLQKLGNGTYGQFFRVEDNETKENFVMKKIYMNQEENGITSSNLRELSVLNSIKHPNVISLIDSFVDKDSVTLIFEIMNYDLKTFFTRAKMISIDLVRSYSFQLLCGVRYLHSKRILHRSIMPKNILLDAKGFLKITHFSTARYYTIPIPPFTPCDIDVTYKSPECLLKAERYGPPSDLWSVGCVIAQMVTPERVPIFNGDSQIDQIAKIYQILGTPDDSVWDEFSLLDSIPNIDSYTKKNLVDFIAEPYSKDDNLIDLLEKLFIYDPSKRISAEEAINHPFFNEIHPNLRAFCCGTAGQGNSAN